MPVSHWKTNCGKAVTEFKGWACAKVNPVGIMWEFEPFPGLTRQVAQNPIRLEHTGCSLECNLFPYTIIKHVGIVFHVQDCEAGSFSRLCPLLFMWKSSEELGWGADACQPSEICSRATHLAVSFHSSSCPSTYRSSSSSVKSCGGGGPSSSSPRMNRILSAGETTQGKVARLRLSKWNETYLRCLPNKAWIEECRHTHVECVKKKLFEKSGFPNCCDQGQFYLKLAKQKQHICPECLHSKRKGPC